MTEEFIEGHCFSRFDLLLRLRPELIQIAVGRVLFHLAVPGGVVSVGKQTHQPPDFFVGQLRDGSFNLLNRAHTRRIHPLR